ATTSPPPERRQPRRPANTLRSPRQTIASAAAAGGGETDTATSAIAGGSAPAEDAARGAVGMVVPGARRRAFGVQDGDHFLGIGGGRQGRDNEHPLAPPPRGPPAAVAPA